MKRLSVILFCILGLAFTSHAWPESEMGATGSSSTLSIKVGSLKSFVTSNGSKFMTFEGIVTSTGAEYQDGPYNSFVVDYTHSNIVFSVMTAHSSGRNFKIDYTKDPSFFNRPVMVIKVFTFIN